MPACRSAAISCTAPRAWEAMPQQKNAANAATTPQPVSVPSSSTPTTAGPTKCVAEVAESSTGRSLNRSTGTEYASTAATVTARARFDVVLPTANSTTRNGTLLTTATTSVDRKSTRLNSSHVAISYAVF